MGNNPISFSDPLGLMKAAPSVVAPSAYVGVTSAIKNAWTQASNYLSSGQFSSQLQASALALKDASANNAYLGLTVKPAQRSIDQAANGDASGFVTQIGLVAATRGVYRSGSMPTSGLSNEINQVTEIEFLPKQTRYSAQNIDAGVSSIEAISVLESNGYAKSFSQDGSVTVLNNGAKTYRFYPEAKSTGGPSASLTIEGINKPVAKIRFTQ